MSDRNVTTLPVVGTAKHVNMAVLLIADVMAVDGVGRCADGLRRTAEKRSPTDEVLS